jgi:pre-mRNA-processing factor 19
VTTGEIAATFATSGPVTALAFSENGFWFASASAGSASVTIWDLRKTGDAANVKTLEVGAPAAALTWDYSAQFLAAVGGGQVTVLQYQKAGKKWSEVLTRASSAKKVSWPEEDGWHITVDDDEGGIAQLRVGAE